ncbi:MAG TPA: class E sortase [Mycobacteriales bacterium]|jgi:sortase A|nr:class E sortase [Mycobacteriales bacterium]
MRPPARAWAAVRERAWLRRCVVAANLCLALVGLGLVAYPFATDAFARHWVQPHAADGLTSPSLAAAYRGATPVRNASPLTRLRLRRLGIDVVVVQGVTADALRAGAGHYPNTPLPGERGNVAIAGHRVTYGRPFRHLDRVVRGDRIELATPVGTFVYEVTVGPFVVAPRDLSVLRQDGRSMLTLTTCNPVHSARERLVVQAVLVGSADA